MLIVLPSLLKRLRRDRNPEAGGVLSGTPNAKGRRWFLSLMLQTIEDFLENNDS